MHKIIAGLDIGSSTIKLVVGEMFKSKLHILACVESPARGIKDGFIVNSESATEALEEAFKKCEDKIGLPVREVVISIPADEAECFLSEGYTSVTNDDKIISSKDVTRAIESTIYNNVSPSREIVAIMPTKFLIDDSVVSDNPVGMSGLKLAVKTVVTTVPKKNADLIVKCLDSIGVKVSDATVGSIADYYEFKTDENSTQRGAMVNIGSNKTTVAIMNKGIMTSCEVIEFGGINIDYDIAQAYKLTRKDAVYLKENIALADKTNAQPNESVILENKNGDKIKINQFNVSEIVMERVEELLNLIKKQINLLTKKEISYIIITGGLTELVEFKSIVDYVFKNASIGNVTEIGARSNKFSTAIGLIKYYDSRLKLSGKDYSIYSIEEQEELSGVKRKVSISDNSLLGKIFGYFFDN